MIDTVIFDIGNVLAKFRWREYIEEIGITGDDAKRVAKATVLNPLWNEVDRGVMSLRDIIEKCVDTDKEVEDKIRLFYKDRRRLVTEYDYSAGLLKSLKEKGYRILLLSNYSEDHFAYIRTVFEFFKYVDGMVISYEIKHIKPEPEIYEEIIQKYELVPENCVFLDDSAANVEAAREFGIHGIHFTDSDTGIAELYRMLGICCN